MVESHNVFGLVWSLNVIRFSLVLLPFTGLQERWDLNIQKVCPNDGVGSHREDRRVHNGLVCFCLLDGTRSRPRTRPLTGWWNCHLYANRSHSTPDNDYWYWNYRLGCKEQKWSEICLGREIYGQTRLRTTEQKSSKGRVLYDRSNYSQRSRNSCSKILSNGSVVLSPY